ARKPVAETAGGRHPHKRGQHSQWHPERRSRPLDPQAEKQRIAPTRGWSRAAGRLWDRRDAVQPAAHPSPQPGLGVQSTAWMTRLPWKVSPVPRAPTICPRALMVRYSNVSEPAGLAAGAAEVSASPTAAPTSTEPPRGTR